MMGNKTICYTIRGLSEKDEPCKVEAERDQLRADLAKARAENGNLFDRARMLAQEVLGLETDLAAMTERCERAERENRVLARMVEMSTGLIPLAPKIDFISRFCKDAEAELGKEAK
jgi:hypothetical protein